ncbi:Monocarboxylate transporter 12 [Eumeta japonica]|uniref:Monocarboxylate transporter 12 n=1 Tax=Eumeta variegata TaxID=151549 RepID=A0A4C1YHU7_EUMVA|nr:Monocarboxylate transporter 12 [Eumeta japonica]
MDIRNPIWVNGALPASRVEVEYPIKAERIDGRRVNHRNCHSLDETQQRQLSIHVLVLALANGICVSGTAAGSFVFPMLIEKLVDLYGLHGTVLLLGGGMLHVCVSATLYRPPPVSRQRKQSRSDTPATTTTEHSTLLSEINVGGFYGVYTALNLFTHATYTPGCVGFSPTKNHSLGSGREIDASQAERLGRLSFSLARSAQAERDNESCSFVCAAGARRFIRLKTENNKDNKLEKLFQPETELTLNQKNILMTEEAKRFNLITEVIHPSLIEVTRPSMPLSDSEDSEGLDVLGVVGLPREVARLRLRPTRSSSILHSVEDLSTDSTCVYKSRGRNISRSLYIKPPLASHALQGRLITGVVVSGSKQTGDGAKDVETAQVKGKTVVERISKYLDVSLLKSWRFGLLCASVALMSCGSPYALYYLPAYTVAKGHTKAAAGRLVAVSAVLDLCGRLGLGWLCDLHLFCRRKAYILSILVAGLAVLALPSLHSWWSLAVASVDRSAAGCYGLCLGCWFLLVPVLLADAFGTARIASSYGLVRMFQSLAAISVPPTAGLVRDVTGGYSWCFYGMGSCMVLGSIPVIVFHVCSKSEDSESTDD